MKTSENTKAGTLDPSFGDNGMVIVDFPNPNPRYIRDVMILGTGPDAKIYFAGETIPFSSSDGYFVGRRNYNGTPDTTFGYKGLISGKFPGYPNISVKSFAIQADGKIVLQGYHVNALITTTLFARFEPDGTLDVAFGTNGYTWVTFARQTAPEAPIDDKKPQHTASNGSLSSIEILPDGKILACNQNSWIIRLTPEGILDETFNKNGFVRVVHPDYSADSMRLFRVQRQNSGKYVGCGVIIGTHNQPYFVRLDDTGTIDNSFGPSANGFVVIKGPIDTPVYIDTIAKQPNQRILGVGATYTFPNEIGVMTSIEPDGTPNIQFNRGEPLFTKFEDWNATFWMGAAVQKDGKIVVSGGVGHARKGEEGYEVVVARYINADLDTSFGDGGWSTTALPTTSRGGYATSMALQDDGKIVVATTVMELDKGIILRYLS
ncbi:hypothetical protein KKQ10_27750 [Pseudomonas sp. MG-9]|uniref:delta-60 repeat domain-containing protein n=1 Tax=Pseudomonas sp. MG-9 TaxID=2839032 RepID=UPI001C0016A0|nr:delta-60 repeat domain-containing protein [Pseudomonas sp. MG-9]MBT9268679.1 hypothetical protein [Pseudomonas sp. MG-9]